MHTTLDDLQMWQRQAVRQIKAKDMRWLMATGDKVANCPWYQVGNNHTQPRSQASKCEYQAQGYTNKDGVIRCLINIKQVVGTASDENAEQQNGYC